MARLATDDLDDALKQYILETVSRQARDRRRRQLGIALALIGAIIAFQWPIGFDSARAIPTHLASLEAPGSPAPAVASIRQTIADDSAGMPIAVDRFAFAAAIRDGF